jgi:hypothetical protein
VLHTATVDAGNDADANDDVHDVADGHSARDIGGATHDGNFNDEAQLAHGVAGDVDISDLDKYAHGIANDNNVDRESDSAANPDIAAHRRDANDGDGFA